MDTQRRTIRRFRMKKEMYSKEDRKTKKETEVIETEKQI